MTKIIDMGLGIIINGKGVWDGGQNGFSENSHRSII